MDVVAVTEMASELATELATEAVEHVETIAFSFENCLKLLAVCVVSGFVLCCMVMLIGLVVSACVRIFKKI